MAAVASNAPAGDKKCRWRKDRKDAPAEVPAPSLALSVGPKENQAASHAFRGLHGRKSNFNLVDGAAVDTAYQKVLGGNAFYYQELVCRSDDFSIFEALVEELEYRPLWMSGGTPLHRPTAIGGEESLKKSPTYERVVRFLVAHFGVEPKWSLVNFYRNGEDFTSFHSDQYFAGVNMTIGASFGEERLLVFEHKESKEQFNFPQHNGDIFAFTDEVNRDFMHAIPRERRRARSTGGSRHTPGRVSVIIFARKNQPEWARASVSQPLQLLDIPHVVPYDPSKVEEDAAPIGDQGSAIEAEMPGREKVLPVATIPGAAPTVKTAAADGPARTGAAWRHGRA